MELELENKRVLITGATGGIGREICKAFLNENASVFHLFRSEKRNEELIQWLQQEGTPTSQLFGCETDLSSEQSIKLAVTQMMKQLGGIDIFVHAVGHAVEAPFLMGDSESWDLAQDINLNTAVRISRLVLKPMLLAHSGSIVFISSVIAWRFGRGVVPYATAKAALNRFAESVACEVAQKGIRVNVVCPGMIKTRMSHTVFERHGDVLKYTSGINRIGEPRDVAPAVLFLASDKVSSFITGQKIVVDGGVSL